MVTSEPSLQERYSQAFRDDTGASFAAITEPDMSTDALPEPRPGVQGCHGQIAH